MAQRWPGRTIGGMKNVLSAMSEVGARRICFTDSIGSFGATAPASARRQWLHENPTQDLLDDGSERAAS